MLPWLIVNASLGLRLAIPPSEMRETVGGPIAGLTVHANCAAPLLPCPSLAATVAVTVPAVVGVPVIRPEAEIVNPAGSPDAL